MTEFMGLPIEGMPDGITPLSVLVIVKALDAEGDVCYFSRGSEGLMTVEALGMAHYTVYALTSGIELEGQ